MTLTYRVPCQSTRTNFVCALRAFVWHNTNSEKAMCTCKFDYYQKRRFVAGFGFFRITWFARKVRREHLLYNFFENQNANRENIINCRRVVMQDTLCFHIQSRRVCTNDFLFIFFPLAHVRRVVSLSYVAILAIFSGSWHRFVCVRQFVFHLFVHFKIRITCKRLDGARLAPANSHTHTHTSTQGNALHITSALRS